MIVWLAAVPPKTAASPAVHEATGADELPLSQRPPLSQLCSVVVVVSLWELTVVAEPSQYSVAAEAVASNRVGSSQKRTRRDAQDVFMVKNRVIG